MSEFIVLFAAGRKPYIDTIFPAVFCQVSQFGHASIIGDTCDSAQRSKAQDSCSLYSSPVCLSVHFCNCLSVGQFQVNKILHEVYIFCFCFQYLLMEPFVIR